MESSDGQRFFAMIWFGFLKKTCDKRFGKKENIHNNLLCGSQDIISVMPVKRTFYIAQKINFDSIAYKLFMNHSAVEIWEKLQNGICPNIKLLIDKYLEDFGERCIGELKLESISYCQDPSLFIGILKSYVKNG